MADRKRRRSHLGGVHQIQIRLYGFCEKGGHFVKTIRTGYQKARDWLAKSAVNRIREDPEAKLGEQIAGARCVSEKLRPAPAATVTSRWDS